MDASMRSDRPLINSNREYAQSPPIDIKSKPNQPMKKPEGYLDPKNARNPIRVKDAFKQNRKTKNIKVTPLNESTQPHEI